MLTSRLIGPLLGCMVINLNMTTCRSPGEDEPGPPSAAPAPVDVKLSGIDTGDLTAREKAQWSAHVTQLLAPCESTPVSIAQCVEEKRNCAACTPAAEYLLVQVRQGRTKAQAEAAYRARFASDQVRNIPLEGSPSKGPTDASIVIVEWADFECPACKAASPQLDELVQAHQDVRLVFKNFPLDIHQNAETAARAAMAADKQGKFWEMHHALFQAEEPPTAEFIARTAKSLGLDMAAFEKDLRSEAVADAVSRDRKQGRDVQLKGTPSVFINGREFSYSMDMATELKAWIALERKLLARPGTP